MTTENRTTPSPAAVEPPPVARRAPTAGRVARLLILLGLLAVVLWLGLKAWRVYGAAQSLMGVEAEARALLAEGVNQIDPDAAEALVLGARADIVTLRDEMAFTRPIAPYLGWVPRYGPALVASPHLLDMADAGSEAGALAVSALKPALAVVQHEDFSGARLGELLPILTAAGPQMAEAGAALERYEAARATLAGGVDAEQLPWRVQQLLALSDEWLPTARSGLGLAPHLPSLLGQDGPRRYLILAQNEDEMRATGGFITGAGVITVQSGQITDLTFRDANQVDNWRDKPYDFPPQPFYDFMGLELFLFRDANYWPDFPTSAQKAMDLFVYGQDAAPLDGAVAIDQEFLRLLVDATGPVPIPGTDRTINANNLLETLRQARDIQEGQEVRDWVRDRKAFLGGFATAIRAKLEADFGAVDPVKLAQNLAAAADERHLTIYVRDPGAADALAAAGWDGRLPSAPPGDFWTAVDSNMGYNKVNYYVERAFTYDVALGGQPQATLTITYRHTGPTSEEACFQGVAEEFAEAADYLAIADQCYWNFLRVYAPQGSVLVDSSRHVVPGDTLFSGQTWDSAAQVIEELSGLTTFANFLLLPRGGRETATFTYNLPEDVIIPSNDANVYRLTVHKQPGRPEPAVVNVTLPAGATLLEAAPAPVNVDGNRLTFAWELIANTGIEVHYR